VAIVGVRNPVDDLNISVRVRPLLPRLREHNIKQLFQESSLIRLLSAFFVLVAGKWADFLLISEKNLALHSS